MSIVTEISNRLSLDLPRTREELLGYLVVVLNEVDYISDFSNLDLDHVESYLGNTPIALHEISNLGIKLSLKLREFHDTIILDIERVLDHATGIQCGLDCPHRRDIVSSNFPDGSMN